MRTPAKKSKQRKTPKQRKAPKRTRPAAKKPEAAAVPAPAPALSAARRKQLRAVAHSLEPLVQVGHAGVTAGVVAAVGQALLDHELIKVRLHEPEDKRAMSSELAERTRSALCGLIGHTAILYKPHPKHPKRMSK